MEIILADDGIGLPDRFDWRNRESLGVKLVQNLMGSHLRGAIDSDTRVGT